jgi:hypothetical protein
MKKMFYAGIALIITIIISPVFMYVVADNVVTDAVNKLDVTSGAPSPLHTGFEYASYADNFLFTNRADIPLTIDYANITAYVTNNPPTAVQYVIASIEVRNETVNANREIGVPLIANVTSEAVLNMVDSLSYSVRWSAEITVSGSYLFWGFTKQIARS